MFTYFLVSEDSAQRLQRLSLSQSMLTCPADGSAPGERSDVSVTPDVHHEPAKPGTDRGWPVESRRPPTLPRGEHGHSCDVASDLAMESIFPNFRRSLAASSKRRRFRNRSVTDAAMSNSLQDCSVHDSTREGSSVRQKDFRIPKSSILESASEGEFRVIQVPPVETEEDGLGNELDRQKATAGNDVTNDVIS